METTTLNLHKQNFKFSAAHFLIFDKQSAERLHGHNYQVKVNITVPQDQSLSKEGYFVDFNVFKKAIKAKLDEWDEMVLLPGKHEDMKFAESGPSLEVRFRERFYAFPKNEVLRLPVTDLPGGVHRHEHRGGREHVGPREREGGGQGTEAVVTRQLVPQQVDIERAAMAGVVQGLGDVGHAASSQRVGGPS